MARPAKIEERHMRRVAALVIALVASVPVGDVAAAPDAIAGPAGALRGAGRIGNATSTAAPTPPPPPPSTPNVSAQQQQVLDLVNVERTSRGLVPLQFAAELNAAALEHTRRQAADGAIYHTDPSDGSDPGDRIGREGYSFSTWGENVAAGYRSAAAVMQGWMTSPGHCRNILNPAFTEIGVGYVSGGARYDQFWTQVFARPRGVERPPGTYDDAWC